jgi:uncharacterized protein (TIGR00369 family)
VSGLGDYVARWLAGEIELAPITELLGVEPVSAGDGRAEVALTADERLHNAMGTLHGGVLLDLADVAMGVAMATVLDDGETFSTLSSSIAYLRPVRRDRLTAAARVVHRGRTTGHLECDVHDGEGELVARVTSVCAIRSRRSPSPPGTPGPAD